jgi:Zn-dependent protease
MDATAYIKLAVFYAIPLLFSLSLHEAAHAWAAEKLGDDTATRLGRKTLNPLPHIDPIWTIVVPIFMIMAHGPVFGGAKPVPVNHLRFRNMRSGLMWVSLAGPGSNLLLLAASFVLVQLLARLGSALPTSIGDPLLVLLGVTINVNLILALFNLIPIPPLDGSKVLLALFPRLDWATFARFERFSFILLLLLVYSGLLTLLYTPAYTAVYRLLPLELLKAMARFFGPLGGGA